MMEGFGRVCLMSEDLTPNAPEDASRRGVLGAAGAAGAFLGAQFLSSAVSHAAEKAAAAGAGASEGGVMQKNAIVYKFKIGDAEAWSISDAYFEVGKGLELMYPESERENMKNPLIETREILTKLPLYVNILLIRQGDHVIIFDAGFGLPEKNWKGWVFDGLKQIGIHPDDVTACFLSHAHTDHIAGFLTDGEPTFKNAPVYVTPEEYEFWTSDNPDFSTSRRDPKVIPRMVKTIKGHFANLKDKIKLVKPGTSFFDGLVTVEEGYGHTPGHAYFTIRSGEEELVHIADLAHHHLLMFESTEWVLAWDHNPVKALAKRKEVLTKLAKEHTRAYGFHLAFPGLGTVLKKGEGFQWAPERFVWK